MSEKEKFPAKVVIVFDDYEKLVINRGSDDGIEKGQRFIIYGLGDELIDPDTNESLGRLEMVRGIGKVSHVQDKASTLTSETTKRVKRLNNTGVISLAMLSDSYIEREERIPFEDPEKGDLAKPI